MSLLCRTCIELTSSLLTCVLHVITGFIMAYSRATSRTPTYPVCEVSTLSPLIDLARFDFVYAVLGSGYIVCNVNIPHINVPTYW